MAIKMCESWKKYINKKKIICKIYYGKWRITLSGQVLIILFQEKAEAKDADDAALAVGLCTWSAANRSGE